MVNSRAEYLMQLLISKSVTIFDMDKKLSQKYNHHFNLLCIYNNMQEGKLEDLQIRHYLQFMMTSLIEKRDNQLFKGIEEEEKIIDFATLFVYWQLDIPFTSSNSFLHQKFLETLKMQSITILNYVAVISIIMTSVFFCFKVLAG